MTYMYSCIIYIYNDIMDIHRHILTSKEILSLMNSHGHLEKLINLKSYRKISTDYGIRSKKKIILVMISI